MPLCEHEIRDSHGGFVAKVDFIWLPWWLILEYDGDEYHGPRRWGADDRVQTQIEALGYRLERTDRFDLRPMGPWPPPVVLRKGAPADGPGGRAGRAAEGLSGRLGWDPGRLEPGSGRFGAVGGVSSYGCTLTR